MRFLLCSTIVLGMACTRPVPSPPDADVRSASDAQVRTTTAASARTTTAAAEVIHRSYRAMGTQITISVLTNEAESAERAASAAFAEFDRIEGLLTVWKPTSDISRLNDAAGEKPVKVAPETMQVLLQARRVSELSGGKFDVTFGALAGVWKFDHDKDEVVPPASEIAQRIRLIDYRDLLLDADAGTAFLRRNGMRAHLGGIGKGYAVDRAVAVMRSAGFSNFMIQAGGDLYVAGMRGERPWRVGIRDPRGPPSAYFAAAEVSDATFSTSGDYERFFLKDGVRYHHILDPDTGQPARLCRSVTIMAPEATLADALDTAVFLVGVEKGLAIIDKVDGVGAVIVDADNRVHISKRLEGKITVLHPPTPGL